MKKIYGYGLVVAVLCLVIIGGGVKWEFTSLSLINDLPGKVFAQEVQNGPSVTKKNFERVLTLEERQPIFMKGAGFIQIGELAANQPIAIIGEDEMYYEGRLGKMNVYVRKEQGTIEKKKLRTIEDADWLVAVKTFEKTAVYEEADVQSDVILELEGNYRYPVLFEEEEWYIVKIGERPGYIHKGSVELDEGLPTLVYHHVVPRDLMKTTASTISVEAFEQQMTYLAERKFETLTDQQLYDYLEGRLVVPSRAVVITFDDGLLSSNVYAYPLLKRYGFSALHHIISARTDRADGIQQFDPDGPLQFLTVAELDGMKDVFQFEAHTDSLHSLSEEGVGVVLGLTADEIVSDLQRNLAQLPTAISIAYPYGHYNEHFIAAAKEVGLWIGFTTMEGYAKMSDSNYEVKRFGMTEKRSFEEFVTYVDGDMTWP